MPSPSWEQPLPRTNEEFKALIAQLRLLVANARTQGEARQVISRIARIERAYRIKHNIGIPDNPAKQAQEIDPRYRIRPHLDHLARRIAVAVTDVENGKNRQLAVSMPPRAGKSTLLSLYNPTWLLRRHPEWDIITTSHDPLLVTGWARSIRRMIEDKPELGVALAKDGGAAGRWETEEGGGLYSTSVRGAMTGRGAKVLVIDDPIGDVVEAHSPVQRAALWDWWLHVAQTRLEPPFLVLAIMTRWHEDDLLGRFFSHEYEGDPADWERISIPAISEGPGDVLGRAEGEPLISPLLEETREQAIQRWRDVRRSVGEYTWSAMYQQRPAPAKGAIFDSGWWRFWTSDPGKATADGRIVYLDPDTLTSGRWLDSWDCAFKATTDSDWVVGQRWVRQMANRYLIGQVRNRWSFTQTIAQMRAFVDAPYGKHVHQRLVEEKANGAAIIDTLKEEISGIKPINPTTSKEARARAITPEIESGNVYLPHPGDPGMEWVQDFLSEARNFPRDQHDDMVDAMTQALEELRDSGRGSVTVPGGRTSTNPWSTDRRVTQTARTLTQGRRFG